MTLKCQRSRSLQVIIWGKKILHFYIPGNSPQNLLKYLSTFISHVFCVSIKRSFGESLINLSPSFQLINSLTLLNQILLPVLNLSYTKLGCSGALISICLFFIPFFQLSFTILSVYSLYYFTLFSTLMSAFIDFYYHLLILCLFYVFNMTRLAPLIFLLQSIFSCISVVRGAIQIKCIIIIVTVTILKFNQMSGLSHAQSAVDQKQIKCLT